MKSFAKIKLKTNSTIKEALNIIDVGAMQIALVLDDKNKLLGTVTDGDIRRGLLRGLALEDSIESIIYKTPTVCTINNSKEEILKIAVEKKLFKIPIVDLEGFLVGIEEIDDFIKQKEHPYKVVLMVGGLGRRLSPLTDNLPKPLLNVGNKPLLETIIDNFSKYGLKNFILSVNYKSEMIEDYFGDGSKFGVNIKYAHENKRMGTAGALSLMKEELTATFFVMNGDLLTNINFDHMIRYHIECQSVATMGIKQYDFQVPYGVVNVNEQRIVSIEEKPSHNFFVNAGIYILDKSVLNEIPYDTFYDMPTLFKTLIANNNMAVSFLIREYWLDVGHKSNYEQANSEYPEVF
jgi:dTDP-glucose pyrophosphorylase